MPHATAYHGGMPRLEIRDATDDDLPGVLRVLAESGSMADNLSRSKEARLHLAGLRQWPNFRLLIAELDGAIADPIR